jgi:prenylcysteine alpha-carboxyl methylesterase
MSADYRNFPWGSVPDMMQDVDDAIQFVLQNCHRYGGDASKVVILGQSAGAHLGFMALLKRQCKVAGFIGLSGIYNVAEAVPLFHKHGLGPHFVKEQLFGGQSQNSDPTQRLNERGAHELPPIQLWHGTQDRTVGGQ